AGCQLWSVSQGDLLATDLGAQVLAVVDSEASAREQQAKSQRSIRGKINGARAGNWQGGYPGLGFDLACVGPDGQERWRVFYEGHHKRLRIWPDGRKESFDGRGNFPGRDPGDTLRLVPSIDKERIENAQRIFRHFATEAISLRALCERLNSLGISPIIGKGWYPARLGQMLRNPCFVSGTASWNKRGHGRFFEWTNGQYQVVPRVKGRAKGGRDRQVTDYVSGEEGEGIIDRDTWDAGQAKLNGIHRTGKAPRNPDLWLAGLLYCHQCGRRMSGWFRKNNPLSYCCATHKQFGRHNEHGCELHCVRSVVIERLL